MLWAVGGVGVLAATWAWSIPPAHPREVNEILGDTPRPPSEGDSPPLNSPRAVSSYSADDYKAGAAGKMPTPRVRRASGSAFRCRVPLGALCAMGDVGVIAVT